MSLIHDALRKAKRESNEDSNRGVVYARGLTGRRGQWDVGRGILLGAILAVVVVAIIGGAMWLRVDHRVAPGTTSAALKPPTQAPPPSDLATPTPEGPPTVSSTGQQAPSRAREVETDASTRAAGPRPTARPETSDLAGSRSAPAPAERGIAAAPNPIPTRAPPTPVASGSDAADRIFDVEADLGYAHLTLDYIVYRSDEPFAQINGVDVRVDSIVDGFKVEEIGRNFVRLRDKRGPVVLRVP